MLSLICWPKVILLSGGHCSCKALFKVSINGYYSLVLISFEKRMDKYEWHIGTNWLTTHYSLRNKKIFSLCQKPMNIIEDHLHQWRWPPLACRYFFSEKNKKIRWFFQEMFWSYPGANPTKLSFFRFSDFCC